MLISDSDSSTRKASRSVGRDTANSAIRAASDGSASPSASSPRTILRRSSAATSSAVFGTRIRWPNGPPLAGSGVTADRRRVIGGQLHAHLHAFTAASFAADTLGTSTHNRSYLSK